jgi:hypothetical protein
VSRNQGSGAAPKRDELYQTAIGKFGRALDRLAAGYEADPEKRHDLRQEIHLRLCPSGRRRTGTSDAAGRPRGGTGALACRTLAELLTSPPVFGVH